MRSSGLRGSVSFGVLAWVVASSAPARAQLEGLSKQKPATKGSTEVAKEGFQVMPERFEEDDKDDTTLRLSAGAFAAQGNAKTIAATAAADYFMRRSASQFTAAVAANYGRSAPAPDAPSVTTVSNYQGRVRYDHFLGSELAAFASVSGRRDRFQGLDLRLSVSPGLSYYFIDEKSLRLWSELGYDLQLDVRRQSFVDAAALDPELRDLDKEELRHNARAFAGHSNQLSESVSFIAGVEYLQSVQKTRYARLNVDLGLTSQIGSAFSIASTFSLKFDNNPLPGVEKTDLLTAVNLVYTFAR